MFDTLLKSKVLIVASILALAQSNLVNCDPVACGSQCGCASPPLRKPCNPIRSYYEETISYKHNPQCKPSKLDKGIECSAIGPSTVIKGGLYTNLEFHFMPLASAYYVARLADAMGYQKKCPTNTTFLTEMDIVAPWSGLHGAIALDLACGYIRDVKRVCTFPDEKYPFLCTGVEGAPGTFGTRLETLSYIPIYQGSNERWTVFTNCWRAKTPQNPNSKEIATSFLILNLDPVFTPEDRSIALAVLQKLGFNTDPSNLIEFDYSVTNCD